ncbi:VWA domain-containing protein [Amnibacterium endophyticum]|uniref:VWA domain-containing protein n=1 Tax=Amnibacterium endophyticum TaxID=2109337 RepID=A0ABW4LLU3_9MICO
MTFLSPIWLLALIPLAALAVAYVVVQRRRQRYAVRFAALPMLDRVVPRRPRWRRHLPAAMVLGALAIIGLAAGRPQVDLRVPYERATVLVAIDTSGSMLAEDVSPTRIDAAKAAAASFVEDLPDSFNVGVVSFAGGAQVVAPATTDHAEVAERIRGLRLSGGGTAIGEAVHASVAEVLRIAAEGEDGAAAAAPTPTPGAGEEAPATIPARLVLLSDGENTSGRSPQDAAQAAAEAEMPVSTIAYGTPDGYILGMNGARQQVPVDEDALRELATSTDGRFYAAGSDEQLRQVYEDIGSSIGTRVEPVELTPWLVVAGLLIALAAAALSLRWFSRLI